MHVAPVQIGWPPLGRASRALLVFRFDMETIHEGVLHHGDIGGDVQRGWRSGQLLVCTATAGGLATLQPAQERLPVYLSRKGRS